MRRLRTMPSAALGSVFLALLLVAAAPQERPELNRLDPSLSMALMKMQPLEQIGRPGEIPLLARSLGVSEGPPGASEPWVDVLIRGPGAESAIRMAGGLPGSRLGGVTTARLPLSQVAGVAAAAGIHYVEAAVRCYPTLEASVPETGANMVHDTYGEKGAGVLVAVYDTGIDFTHPDFIKADGMTRIAFLWDQSDNSGTAPTGYAYGSEWTAAQINDEIDGSPVGLVTQQDINGHRTHVAGIAAGNGRATGNGVDAGTYTGMAPEADLLIIKGGDNSFSSADVQDGVAWAVAKAAALGQPVVINLSLGGHGYAHDGTSLYEQALNSASGAGSIIVAAAGNEADDLIHGRATVNEVQAVPKDSIGIEISSYTPSSGTGNDYVKLDIWYSGTAGVRMVVRSPNGHAYGPIDPGNLSFTSDHADGHISAASSSAPNANNGDKEAIIAIDDQTAGQEPVAGTWWVVFELLSGEEVTIDTWIYDNTLNGTISGGTADYSIAVPACAEEVIAVGSYVSTWGWTALNGLGYSYLGSSRLGDYSTFSSWGPTRDGRTKPDIMAPGQGIFAALSTQMSTAPDSSHIAPDGVHRVNQGTSQAAPHVAGAVALMLGTSASLTPTQVLTALQNGAESDSYTGTVPNNTWGVGKLDARESYELATGTTDATPPDVTIGLLRNTVLTEYLDLYVWPRETLPDIPSLWVSSTSGDDTLTTELISTEDGPLYVADYLIPAAGNYTLNALVFDAAGNDSIHTRNFSAAGAGLGGGMLVSADGIMTATFTSGALASGGYVIATPFRTRPGETMAAGVEEGLSPAYRLIPEGASLDRKARLSFAYDPARLGSASPEDLRICRWTGEAWTAVESWTDTERRRVEASITELGIYQLRIDETVGFDLSFGLEQNYPNPFNGSTRIRYTLARSADVSITILNVRGQRVRTLVDRHQSAGRHIVSWDGRGEGGRDLASGIYLVVMRTDRQVFTRKVLLLQ